MGFSSFNQIRNILNTTGQQLIPVSKTSGVAEAGTIWVSSWAHGGSAAAETQGVFGTPLTARASLSSSVGSFPFINPSRGRSKYLLKYLGKQGTGGPIVIVDRLLEAPFNGTVTSGTFNGGVPMRIPPRDDTGHDNGNGCFMFVENVTNASTTAATMTITYTNQAGTTGQTTASFNIPANINQGGLMNSAGTNDAPFVVLVSGDSGVQAIQSYTLSGTVTVTQANIVICRPIIIMDNSMLITEQIRIGQYSTLPILYPNSSLQIIALSTGASGSIVSNAGMITTIEN